MSKHYELGGENRIDDECESTADVWQPGETDSDYISQLRAELIQANKSAIDVWDECIAIAEAEKRKGLANLKRGDDSDYDEGYSEAAQLIATFIREAKARSLAASALGATGE